MAGVKCPKGERIWANYYGVGHKLMFIVTAKTISRDWYFLYQVSGDTLKKLGKAHTPVELEEKYKVQEAIGCG